MDLATDRIAHKTDLVQLLKIFLWLLNLGLIGYFFWLRLSLSQLEVMAQFTLIRNRLYYLYMALAVIWGLTVFTRSRDNPDFLKSSSSTSQLLPLLITSFIFTTFSYAFADILLSLANLGTQLLSHPQISAPL